MSEYIYLKNYVENAIREAGNNNLPVPTYGDLANQCNKNNITTPTNKQVEITTIQRIVGSKGYVIELWKEGRKQNPAIEEIDYAKLAQEAVKKQMEIPEPATPLHELRQFCLQLCHLHGEKGNVFPTMQTMAETANSYGLTTSTGKEITVSTIQRMGSRDEMKLSWKEGMAKKRNINNYELENFLKDENVVSDNDIKIKERITVFFSGKGFIGVPKPTLHETCQFLNSEMTFRNGVSEWTTSTLHRYLESNGIDTQHIWEEGIRKGKEALGQPIHLHDAIASTAKQWGQNGFHLPPNLHNISEMLFGMNFTSRNGKRLYIGKIQTEIAMHQINTVRLWEEGHEEYKAKKRAERETLEDEEFEQTKHLIPYEPKPMNMKRFDFKRVSMKKIRAATPAAYNQYEREHGEYSDEPVNYTSATSNVYMQQDNAQNDSPCTVPDETIPLQLKTSNDTVIDEQPQAMDESDFRRMQAVLSAHTPLPVPASPNVSEDGAQGQETPIPSDTAQDLYIKEGDAPNEPVPANAPAWLKAWATNPFLNNDSEE